MNHKDLEPWQGSPHLNRKVLALVYSHRGPYCTGPQIFLWFQKIPTPSSVTKKWSRDLFLRMEISDVLFALTALLCLAICAASKDMRQKNVGMFSGLYLSKLYNCLKCVYSSVAIASIQIPL